MDKPSHHNPPILRRQDPPLRIQYLTRDLYTSRCPIDDQLINSRQYETSRSLFALGSKPVNSRPRHSMMMRGANWPLELAVYGLGGEEVSNFAELSRLHIPHRQTKWAVLPLPPATSRSSCK